MPISKRHSNNTKSDRQPLSNAPTPLGNKKMQKKPKEFNRTDLIVDDVYADIANGMSRSEIIKKLMLGLYPDQQGKEMKRRNAQDYYNGALDRFAVDTDIEAERLRKMFYGRYEAILEQCIKNGDMYNARATLDSMSRIFGIERKEPSTAIQINSDREGGVTVNFGFKEENET